MKKFLLVVVFVSVLTGQALASQAADSINNFAFNAGKIIAGQPGSFFFSPFSIISAFGMAYAGASGDTAKEIEAALGFSPEVHVSLGELMKDINSSGNVSAANRVWLKNGLTLREDFRSTLLLNYNSKAQVMDFKGNAEGSREEINAWVSDKTRGKIKDLIRSLDPDTRMILTNAIYFNAEWSKKFSKKKTASKPFYYDGKKSVKVPMMIQYSDFEYAEDNGTKIIMLPYKGGRFAMVAVLPPADGDIEMNAEIFSGWLKSLSKYDVDLWLPKFKTEKRYELNNICKALGINTAFTNDADFSGMTEDERLRIDAVIHQTFIDVDEEKTEAAAATAMMMRATAVAPMSRPKAEFHADRPFLYFIMDRYSDTILFMGRQNFE